MTFVSAKASINAISLAGEGIGMVAQMPEKAGAGSEMSGMGGMM